MYTFGQIIFGIIGVILGFLITWKAYDIKNIFGLNAWAENNLGAGGTISLYRIVGVLIIVGSFMYASGLLQVILVNTLGGLFGA